MTHDHVLTHNHHPPATKIVIEGHNQELFVDIMTHIEDVEKDRTLQFDLEASKLTITITPALDTTIFRMLKSEIFEMCFQEQITWEAINNVSSETNA